MVVFRWSKVTLDNTGVGNHNVYAQILDHWYYLEIISDHFTGVDHYLNHLR